jgi:hypothetical protein
MTDGSDATEALGPPVVVLFLPGRVINPLNTREAHWGARATWAKRWRESTSEALLSWWHAHGRAEQLALRGAVREPLTIRFTLQVSRLFDPDALAAAAKPVLDELVLCFGTTDAATASHTVSYFQRRQPEARLRGIQVEIWPSAATERGPP